MHQRCTVEKVNLTKRTIKALSAPASGRRYVYDAKTPHLALCITSSGSKSYYRCGRIHKQAVRFLIGSADELTPEQARDRCKQINAIIASGGDPRAKRQQDGVTFGELWDWYLENHSKKHKKHWQRDERRYERILKPWASRPLTTITPEIVSRLHTKVSTRDGAYAGNHALELIRHMFNKAIDLEWIDRNPCRLIDKNEVHSRERYLLPDEVERFFEALANVPKVTTRDFILMSLLTGARRSNTAAMRWDQIDWNHRTWTIPGSQSKNKKPMHLPLTDAAIEILERRKDNGSEWVFPGGGRTGHIVEPKHAWKKLCTQAGLKDFRFHDLRRTLGSWQAQQNTSLHIIGQSLGHTSTASTQVYARLQIDPVRASVTAATEAILKKAKKTQK